MERYVIFDIGGTTVKHAIMNAEGEAIESFSYPTPAQGNDEIYELLIQLINESKRKYPIKGVALSIPGAVDINSGEVYYAGSVIDLMHSNVKEKLKETGLPIELENDANCVALAEKWKGNAVNTDNFVCLTLGTGIGGSIYLNGNLYRGKQGMAGEIGLMLLHADSKTPKHLLFEKYSFSRLGSTWNLEDRISKKLERPLTGREIFTLYEQKDEGVTKEVESFYHTIAIGTLNIIHVMAPEKILFGGGISSQHNFISKIKQKISTILPEALELTELDHCHFYNQSGQLGALYHFLKQTNK
ncbi:ROK family protein [Chengkuizengella marina]|uniref:ROK family protein n=1 Tax=Chengkuizengella marina TaxID=2507566 RepID=A0A6N9Q4X3_9BACL|nr:ROK family protein [Chengkuizengella marina]NBI29801.1 ROK family protein [Chengkuizengella marina]